MITLRSRRFVTAMAIAAGLLTVLEPFTAAEAARRGGGMERGAGHNMNRNVNRNANRDVNKNANRNVNRNVNKNVNRNVNRNVNVGTVGWARPSAYTWRPGGAIAAGAAIGVVSAATAAAWAGPAPGPNMCWYYTDASRRQGFWDVCQ
jgi:hypothetical protein